MKRHQEASVWVWERRIA